NTIPPKTLVAFLDHGQPRLSIGENLEQSWLDMELLEKLGIDFAAVTSQLEDEGVEKFRQAHLALLEIVEGKRTHFIHGLNGLVNPLQAALKLAISEKAVSRMYAHDPRFWTEDESGFDEIRNRLGWLGLPSQQVALIEELE